MQGEQKPRKLEKGIKTFTRKQKAGILIALDVLYMALATMIICLFARNTDSFKGFAPAAGIELPVAAVYSLAYIAVAEMALVFSGVYRRALRFLTLNDLLRGTGALLAAYAVVALETYIAQNLQTTYVTACFFSFIVIFLLSRMMYYNILKVYERHLLPHGKEQNPTLIVGAGAAGIMLARELLGMPDRAFPLYFCDDDPAKQGTYIEGIEVLTTTLLIPEVCEKKQIKTIYIALPSVEEDKVEQIKKICQTTHCATYFLPKISSLITQSPFLRQSKKLSYAEMLGRAEVSLQNARIADMVNNRVVLVTGGGGSIGSELCRQIAELGPKRLIILDIYENNAYDIQQDLLIKNPTLNLSVEIASVRDEAKINHLFEQYCPDIVFHAAAHKHVPLMETDPEEAVKNNVGGTYHVAVAAAKHHTSKFVLISTDKAVNPTNVMGATKRMCEMILQHCSTLYPDTCYAMVRFGNVLGSNGSVIPLFKKQIQAGGPVTVTHPDVVRYFMTIPEAVSLVLEAGALAKGGEVFVLNMGEAVKILTLAENVIRFHGYEPYTEIPIQFTGLRPGEKLYEEMLMKDEGLTSTENEKIFIGKQVDIDHTTFEPNLERLLTMAESNDSRGTVELLHELVPTFRDGRG